MILGVTFACEPVNFQVALLYCLEATFDAAEVFVIGVNVVKMSLEVISLVWFRFTLCTVVNFFLLYGHAECDELEVVVTELKDFVLC